jgi:DNA-binding LacI/PurR family transcriptional regulator
VEQPTIRPRIADVDPPLTTVHQPIRQKGEEAARMLLAIVAGGDRTTLQHRRLATRLVVGGSSGPARAGR